jgi:hypothetical protein
MLLNTATYAFYYRQKLYDEHLCSTGEQSLLGEALSRVSLSIELPRLIIWNERNPLVSAWIRERGLGFVVFSLSGLVSIKERLKLASLEQRVNIILHEMLHLHYGPPRSHQQAAHEEAITALANLATASSPLELEKLNERTGLARTFNRLSKAELHELALSSRG